MMNEIGKQKIVWNAVMDEWGIWEFQDWLHSKLGTGKTELAKKRENMLVCCPICFGPVKTKELKCPNCRSVISNEMLETLRDNAFEVTVYGWSYRREYENAAQKGNIHEGEISIRYAIQPPADWLTYLGSIVLASIIGGLSYDVFKRVLAKISGTFQRHFRRNVPSNKWCRLFYKNIEEYAKGKRDPDSVIFEAYIRNGLTSCAFLRASVENSPESITRLTETLKKLGRTLKDAPDDKGELELPDFIFAEREPPTKIVKNQIKELKQELQERELRIKQLQDYLVEKQTFRDIKKEDNDQTI